jgi:hypothetical protein
MVLGRHLPQLVSKRLRTASLQLVAEAIFGYVSPDFLGVAFVLAGGSVFTVIVATVFGFAISKAL